MGGIPVITTFKGKGLISDSHPLGCGVLGRSGTPIASYFMNESDLLIVLGASFSNHTGITDHIPTIQVDYDLLTLGKFHAVDFPVWGEIGETVRLISEALADLTIKSDDRRAAIADRWEIWRAEKRKRIGERSSNGLSAAVVFDTLTRTIPANAVIAVDVGNNTYSFGRYFECEAQSVLMSGDGGFGQYMGELTTAVKYGMNITHILLNNAELGKISKEQRSGDWDVWQTSLHNPNFSKYAHNCGAMGIRVSDESKLEGTILAALAHEGPALVEIMTDASLI